MEWQVPGSNIHDRLRDMASDGSEFWLSLADGGSVHFEGINPIDTGNYTIWQYQATEVFDPHGLHTALTYDTNGHLTRVEQDGGRWLTISWSTFDGLPDPAISRVQTGGSVNGGTQAIDYDYQDFTKSDGSHVLTLTSVTYPEDPVPGQSVAASYVYSNCYDEEPCAGEARSAYPLLKIADDPRFEGGEGVGSCLYT